MVTIKYVARPAAGGIVVYVSEEFRKVQISTDSIIAILGALNAPIQLGPADSGGIGYRALRIPN
jgi:hypothetical protein